MAVSAGMNFADTGFADMDSAGTDFADTDSAVGTVLVVDTDSVADTDPAVGTVLTADRDSAVVAPAPDLNIAEIVAAPENSAAPADSLVHSAVVPEKSGWNQSQDWYLYVRPCRNPPFFPNDIIKIYFLCLGRSLTLLQDFINSVSIGILYRFS